MKQSLVAFAVLAALLASAHEAGAAKKAKPKKEEKAYVKEAPSGDLFATFQTSLGDIIIKLYEQDAPKTVENFVGLANGAKEWKSPTNGQWLKTPLYNATYFHRVIPGFMIQGGDPYTGQGGDANRAGTGGPGYRFEDELHNGHVFDKPGYLAMANSGPNTNGSQFFITEVPTPHLDNRHTIFGEVVSGIDLIPKIAEAGNMKVQLVRVVVMRGALARK